MSPTPRINPYTGPEDQYVYKAEPALSQIAKYFREAAAAYESAANDVSSSGIGERERSRRILTTLRGAEARGGIACRLAIEYALDNNLMTQNEVANALGTSRTFVYTRRHNPLTVDELESLLAQDE